MVGKRELEVQLMKMLGDLIIKEIMKKMNFIRIKRANWIVATAMLAFSGVMVASCSKESDPTEVVEPQGDKLVISVQGINRGDTDATLKAGLSTATGKISTTGSSAVASKIYEFSDVDMAVSVDNNVPVKTTNITTRKRVSGLAADASLNAVEEIETEVKYVVYLYAGNTLVTSVLLEAGTQGTVEGLDPEGSYTWVALSYNSKEDSPELTPATADVELPENEDVLYASGTVNLATDPTISILFDHVYSRIGIELNTIGIFGEITGTPAVSVSGLNLASGSLNLLSGVLTPGATFAPNLTYADFENVDPAYNDQKIAYVYTAPVAAQTVQVTVQNLIISHADGGLSRTYFTSPGNFTQNVTPVAGQSHRLLFNVVESALTTNYGGNTVEWGRSNLYYRGDNGGLRDYAFYANNQQTSRGDGYFAFGGTIPGQFATTSTQGDPCALVYPQGLWKQPGKADFNGLVRGDIELNELTGVLGGIGQVVDATGVTGILNLLTSLLGNTVATLVNTAAPNSTLGPAPYVYGQYTISSGAPASGTNAFGDANSASNNLRFYYNGQISSLTVLQGIGEGDGLLNVGLNELSADLVGVNLINTNIPLLDSYGDLTALWTNEQGTNILGLAGAGTWGYLGNAGRGFEWTGILPTLNARFHMANNTGELLNGVNALGIDVLSTTMKNVRCVRAD